MGRGARVRRIGADGGTRGHGPSFEQLGFLSKGQMSQGWAVENSLLGVGHLSRHTKAVELCLVPEVEARLTGIASEAGKAANEVVQGLVANYVDHDEWFRREVRKGLDSRQREGCVA